MKKEEFDAFFKPYAKNVDTAGEQSFWKLSDALITKLITTHIPDPGEKEVLMDAGGGTARWALALSEKYKAHFIVYDLSEDMLAKAKENILHAKKSMLVDVVHGDMCDMSNIPSESIAHIVSIYSPISFIDAKEKAVGELFRVLKPGGRIFIMGHGYYNALASKVNNYRAPAKELETLANDYRVAWAPHVPVLSVFSQESMEELLAGAGFTIVKTFGVPVFVQPGAEDFDPKNKQRSAISTALEAQDFFDEVFDLEMRYNGESTVANRGMNIFTLAQK